jgi:molybdate transport system permease protein
LAYLKISGYHHIDIAAYWLAFGLVVIQKAIANKNNYRGYNYHALGAHHGLGHWLQKTFNVQFVFSFQVLVLASVIYSMPFMISPVKSAFQQLPVSLSQASYTLGKTQWQTFRHVLLPNIKPSLLTAAVLTFAHTLGEFGVVLMIGGNISGVTRVASIAVYDSVEQMNYTAANNYSLILFAITFVMVLSVFIYNKYQAKSPLE